MSEVVFLDDSNNLSCCDCKCMLCYVSMLCYVCDVMHVCMYSLLLWIFQTTSTASLSLRYVFMPHLAVVALLEVPFSLWSSEVRKLLRVEHFFERRQGLVPVALGIFLLFDADELQPIVAKRHERQKDTIVGGIGVTDFLKAFTALFLQAFSVGKNDIEHVQK